ncbi:cell division protein FtsL [Mangrovicella endophytica]|uniref:cell division protein FtsL n=1 Tax=Mangrovicella endophytica TaxID=2066697 RepID=UPI000C9E4CD8|nr:hypothetical protein [Mangrovicella endophytica]
MLKTIDIVLIALMVSAAAWTFGIKYDAENIEEQVAKVSRKIDLERETIALLDADWSLLNQPARLERLSDAFKGDLALEPVRPDQIVAQDELPAQPVLMVPNESTTLGGFADASGTVVR